MPKCIELLPCDWLISNLCYHAIEQVYLIKWPVNVHQIKSNQITFIVTSPQHKCLGEWNSYERAPDSAEKQQTIYLWTDSAKKNKKKQTIYIWTDSAKNCTGAFTVLQTVQKKKTTRAIYIWTDSAKKQQQFTYGQYIFTDCTEDNVQNTHTCTQYA